MAPSWLRSRAILGGLATAKAHDKLVSAKNLLTPFSVSMSPAQYDMLKSEAELPCITAQFAKILVEALLRKRPTLNVKGHEALNTWLLDEFGQDGLPIEASLSMAAQEELASGRCWVFVDHPTFNEEGMSALSAEERKLVRPYPIIRRAEEVINWHYSTDQLGRRQLLFVLTRAYESTYAPDAVHPVVREVVWRHYLNEQGNYAVDKYLGPTQNETPAENGQAVSPATEGAGGGFEKGATIEVLAHGLPLAYIPAWPISGKVELQQPPLMPLIEKEVSLYNKMTRRNHLLYNASTFTPVIMTSMIDSEFDKIAAAGLGSWIKLDIDSKVDALKTPTDALKDYETAILNGITEMAKLGVRMLAAESNQSGIALEIRNAAQTAQLGTLNTQISTTWRQVIRCMIQWQTGVEVPLEAVEFALSSDFLASNRDVNSLRLITEWYENGHIPRSVFTHVLRENDYLPDGYDDQEGLTEIGKTNILPPLEE